MATPFALRGLFRGLAALLLALASALGMPAMAASNVIKYTYDPLGNVTQMERLPGGAVLSISSVSPPSGSVGTAVTISGTGFDANSANDLVSFNGAAAIVTAVTPTSISTSVPSGATTGRITVTVGTATATSPQDFTVVAAGAPTITSFSPAFGVAGTVVTVTGNNFDTAAGATTVRLNGVTAVATISSSTSLTFTAPTAGSGPITVTTGSGTGAGPTDFIVPPSGTNGTDITTVLRLFTDGSSHPLALTTANKSAMLLVDGSANGYYTIQFDQFAESPTTTSFPYTVISPSNAVLASGYLGGTNRSTIHLPKLPSAGTYSILLSPGAATVNANVQAQANPTVTIDGAGVSAGTASPNESTRLIFSASLGQLLGIGIGGTANSPNLNYGTTWDLILPDGTRWDGPSHCSNTTPTCATALQAPQGGTYQLIATPVSVVATSFTAYVTNAITGALAADVPVDVTLAKPGQTALFNFTANSGDSLAIGLSGINPTPWSQSFDVRVTKPGGSYLASCNASTPNGAYCELGTVATSGVYSVSVTPEWGVYGTFRIALEQGPLLDASANPTTFTTSKNGEAARFRFAGTAGQNLSLAIANLVQSGYSGSSTFNVYGPDGSQAGSVYCNPAAPSRCNQYLGTLGTVGTYSAVMLSAPGAAASGSVQLDADLTGALTAGTPLTINATRSGQRGRYSFSANAGDSFTLKLLNVLSTPASQSISFTIYKPDGNYLTAGSSSNNNAASLNLWSLPTTGTYTVILQPSIGYPWQAQLLVDGGTSIAVDGALVPLVTTGPGEMLRYKFTGSAGQHIDLGISGLAYSPNNGTQMTVYSSNGNSLGGTGCYPAGACELTIASLPADGIYVITVAAPSGTSLTAGSLAVSTPLPGTLTVGNPAQTVALTRTGQTARYTFSGTAGQTLRLAWANATVTGGYWVAVDVYAPDGSHLNSGTFSNGSNSGIDLSTLPSTGTYTVVLDPAYGGTMSADLSLTTR
jgi:hypothetical protein